MTKEKQEEIAFERLGIRKKEMVCGKCPYSTVDFRDDEDVYYCPFEVGRPISFVFHSGTPCAHDLVRVYNDEHKFGHEVIVEAS